MENKLPYQHKIIIETLSKQKVEFMAITKGDNILVDDKNIQLWIEPSQSNKTRLYKALNNLGYNTAALETKAFKQHVMSNSIDLDLSPKLMMNAKLSVDYDYKTYKNQASIKSYVVSDLPGRNASFVGIDATEFGKIFDSPAKTLAKENSPKKDIKESIKNLLGKGRSR